MSIGSHKWTFLYKRNFLVIVTYCWYYDRSHSTGSLASMADSVSSGVGVGEEGEMPGLEEYIETFLTILIILNIRRTKKSMSRMWVFWTPTFVHVYVAQLVRSLPSTLTVVGLNPSQGSVFFWKWLVFFVLCCVVLLCLWCPCNVYCVAS